LRIVKLYRFLCGEKKEFVLSKQIVRSGTSIGANVEEAIGGQSKKDFFAKMSIAYKEAERLRGVDPDVPRRPAATCFVKYRIRGIYCG
jgi:four helix bundle protein